MINVTKKNLGGKLFFYFLRVQNPYVRYFGFGTGMESSGDQVVENFKFFRLLLIRSEIHHIMKNQSNMEEIKIEPKDKYEDKSNKSAISGINKKIRYPCDKCHYSQEKSSQLNKHRKPIQIFVKSRRDV